MDVVMFPSSLVDTERWKDWLARHSCRLADHDTWRALLSEVYKLPWHRLVAVDRTAAIQGSLALVEVRHPVFGHYLATAPFSDEGGLRYAGPEGRDALLAAARALLARRRASYLVIRTGGEDLLGFVHSRRYCGAFVELDRGVEELWRRLPATTRNQIRRGRREGFEVASGRRWIDAVAHVFRTHMSDLGSPAHGLDYFRALADHFGEHARFVVVREGREVVAGAVMLVVGDTAINCHSVALRRFNRRCPNYLLYWHLLEEGCRADLARFDMGRSLLGSGALRFKKNWNATVYPLSYNYDLRTRRQPPFVDPRNPHFRLPIAAWRRLPETVTRSLGPWLMRGLA